MTSKYKQMKHDEEIIAVARRYRSGAFAVKEGWERLGIASTPWWSAKKIAAAAAIAVVVSATAGIFIHNSLQEPAHAEITPAVATAPRYTVRAIDFEDAPLPLVLETMKETYGVEIVNIPDNADTFKLTLHYEGNADDLVETINNIFGTEIAIKE